MLRIEGLEVFYGRSQALFGVSLEVGEGEAIGFMGRNGMGKTTTVNALFGIVRAATGTVLFEGRELRDLPSHLIARLGLGLVPEGRQVFPNLTVEENLTAAAANRGGRRNPWTAAQLFAMFPELEARRRHMGNLLSGGEQQMLAIGRALMTNPKLLVLDEATEGLAPLVRRRIWACLAALKAEGHAILAIDRHVPDLARLADRHYIVEKGRIVWTGSSAALAGGGADLERWLGV
ncbi:MAG: ABC transporter ATP-binding protein [Alphaproteobacteria bacterium]|nr:ABC transporter ATP-binding protein [Alphaproteobacteria bacterium]MCY4319958.1 ABC transporter ATP-binding protein [Alphaproteobacteria bacterium]